MKRAAIFDAIWASVFSVLLWGASKQRRLKIVLALSPKDW